MFFINRHINTGNDSSLFANSYIGSINNNTTSSNSSCNNNSNNDDKNKKNTKLMTDKTIFYDDMWKYDIPDEAKHFSINLTKSWSLCNNKSHGNWMNYCSSDTMTEKNRKYEECEELEQEHEFNNRQSTINEKERILNIESKIEEECKACCRHSNNNVKDRSSTLPVQHSNNSIMISSKKNKNSINSYDKGIIQRVSEASWNVEHDKYKNNSDRNSCNNAKIVFTDFNNDDEHRHIDGEKKNMKNKKRCSHVGRSNDIEEQELIEQEEKEEEYQCSIEPNKRLSFTPSRVNISLTKPAMTSLQRSDNSNEQSVNNKDISIPLDKVKCDKICELNKYKAIRNENNRTSEYSHYDVTFDKSSIGEGSQTTHVKNEYIIHDDNVSLPWTSSARSCTTYSSQQSLLELSNTLTPNAHLRNEWETLEEHPNSSLEFVSGESSLVAEPSHQPALQLSCSPLAMEMSTSLLEKSSSLCNEEYNLYCQELQHTEAQKMMEHLDLDEEICQLQSEQSTNNMQIFSCTNTDEKECSSLWSYTPYNDDPLHSHDDYGLTESIKNSSESTNQNSIFSSPLGSNVMKDVDILNKGDDMTIVNKKSNNNNNNFNMCTQRTWTLEHGKHNARELNVSLLRFTDR